MQFLMGSAPLRVGARASFSGAIEGRITEYEVSLMGRLEALDLADVALDRLDLVHFIASDVLLQKLEERCVTLDGPNPDLRILECHQK